MATVEVTYWRDIPVLVTARDGGDEVRVPLQPAFQDLVDRVAMQEGLAETDAYLEGWRVGPAEPRAGTAQAAAEAAAGELDARFEEFRGRYLRATRSGSQ